jgi:hypothetical protein
MGEVGRLKDWFTKLPFALQDNNGLIAFPLNVNDVVGWMFGTWVVVVVMVGIVAMVVGIVAKPFASELYHSLGWWYVCWMSVCCYCCCCYY